MLIHPSQKKYDHQIVVNKIQGILDDWRNKAKTKLSGVMIFHMALLEDA